MFRVELRVGEVCLQTAEEVGLAEAKQAYNQVVEVLGRKVPYEVRLVGRGVVVRVRKVVRGEERVQS